MKRKTGQTITRLRRAWAPTVALGRVHCRRCGLPITAGQVWDLGHDHDLALGGHPSGGMRPEHALKRDCPSGGNRSAGARLGAQLRTNPRRRLADYLREL
jgi:hypothetical protein